MTAPLRIVHCFRSPIGGIFRHVRDLIDVQHEQGHQIGILCDNNTGGAHEESLFDEVRPKLALGLHRIKIRRTINPTDLIGVYNSYREIRSLKPDVLHSHGAKGGAYARLIGTLLRMTGQKTARVYCPHGGSIHFDHTKLSGRIYFLIERFLERFTDGLIFVSEYERDGYARKVGKPRCATSLVYNGLKKHEFEPVDTIEEAADFLYIGMMRDLKGPDLFLHALQHLNAKGRVTAHMVGDGPDLEKYHTMARDCGLGEVLTFHGSMPARQAFALAEHVVVPSRAESMPYIVLEAIAAGKPLLATDVGGVPEIFGPYRTRLVKPDDAVALGDAMQTVLSNPARLSEAEELKDRVQGIFSATEMAKTVGQVYAETIERLR